LLLGACGAIHALRSGQIPIHLRWLVGAPGAVLALPFLVTWSPFDSWAAAPSLPAILVKEGAAELATGAIPFDKAGLSCQAEGTEGTEGTTLTYLADLQRLSRITLPSYDYPDPLRACVRLNDADIPYIPAECDGELFAAANVGPGLVRITLVSLDPSERH
jgi:hypothetical protein